MGECECVGVPAMQTLRVVRGKDPKPHPEGSAKIYLDETECEIIFEDKYN